MDKKVIENLIDRTDAKLRYADIYVTELRKLNNNGDDIDRAHQESFLFHLWGAKDAFLIELNYYYNINLPIDKVRNGTLQEELKKINKVSVELDELVSMEKDNSNWLFVMKDMRDSSTHRTAVPRAFHIGGEFDNQVFLRNQKTGQNIERHFVDEFAEWSSHMKILLQRLRTSALSQNNIVMT
jgi:hypothetical protein